MPVTDTQPCGNSAITRSRSVSALLNTGASGRKAREPHVEDRFVLHALPHCVLAGHVWSEPHANAILPLMAEEGLFGIPKKRPEYPWQIEIVPWAPADANVVSAAFE